MEEIKERIEHDLEYYHSGIKQLYMRSYQMYLFSLLAIMMVTIVGIGLADMIIKVLLVIVFLLELAAVFYILRYIRGEAFDRYFQKIKEQLPKKFQKMQTIETQEDDKAYYFLDDQELFVKLNKKNTRNFPSQISQYTLLVGFAPELNKDMLEQPLEFFYYDITQIKHSENYKKEILKNTNFLAKRKKRRVQSAIVTAIFLLLLGIVLFSGVKTFFKEKNSEYNQYQVEHDFWDN